ncbi:MAG: hypothetical protein ABL893_11500 [Hyphomicrobium sp.]|nr:hypothetical protein [Hyphomicrobium sp.]
MSISDDEILEAVLDIVHARLSTVVEAEQVVKTLRNAIGEGSGVAAYELAMFVCPGFMAGTDEVRQYFLQFSGECEDLFKTAFPMLLRNAEEGRVHAMSRLSVYYQTGIPPVTIDHNVMREWDDRIAKELAKDRKNP